MSDHDFDLRGKELQLNVNNFTPEEQEAFQEEKRRRWLRAMQMRYGRCQMTFVELEEGGWVQSTTWWQDGQALWSSRSTISDRCVAIVLL